MQRGARGGVKAPQRRTDALVVAASRLKPAPHEPGEVILLIAIKSEYSHLRS